jgi:hypothetical protein
MSSPFSHFTTTVGNTPAVAGLESAAAVRAHAEKYFPNEFAALTSPSSFAITTLKLAGTSIKSIRLTKFHPRPNSPEYLWPGSGKITVLAYIRDNLLLACQLRDKKVVDVSFLVQWLERYGPT